MSHTLREAHQRAALVVQWFHGLCEATRVDPKRDPITQDAEYVAETLRRALRFEYEGAHREPSDGVAE